MEKLNILGTRQIPCLFILDYELKNPMILPLDQVNSDEILFDVRGHRNFTPPQNPAPIFDFKKTPVSFSGYSRAFNRIRQGFLCGESFLANLTFATPIETTLTLKEIFYYSKAPYRLWMKNRLALFSPEPFIRIQNGEISSFPMKGTISASIPDAEKIILSNPKELAEHMTMVDLIRNDLGGVAYNIRVPRFRFIEEVKTFKGSLLQVSSQITGDLKPGFETRLGDLLLSLLPAGSVTGAPKKRTVEILKEAEPEARGFYTGVFGIFDGKNLDSSVMIRFIEETPEGMIFRSGGGLTFDSKAEEEYEEMKEKVYVPIY